MESKRIDDGIKLINNHKDDIALLALKVLKELSNHEQSKIKEENNVSKEDATMWKTLHYVFQQAAFAIMKPSNFGAYLEGKGLKKEISEQLAQLWSSEAKAVVESLKKQTILPQVTSVETSIHYHIAGTAEAPSKSPTVILDLGVEEDKKKSCVTVEFNEDELSSFYKMLEEIQTSLDSVL